MLAAPEPGSRRDRDGVTHGGEVAGAGEPFPPASAATTTGAPTVPQACHGPSRAVVLAHTSTVRLRSHAVRVINVRQPRARRPPRLASQFSQFAASGVQTPVRLPSQRAAFRSEIDFWISHQGEMQGCPGRHRSHRRLRGRQPGGSAAVTPRQTIFPLPLRDLSDAASCTADGAVTFMIDFPEMGVPGRSAGVAKLSVSRIHDGVHMATPTATRGGRGGGLFPLRSPGGSQPRTLPRRSAHSCARRGRASQAATCC